MRTFPRASRTLPGSAGAAFVRGAPSPVRPRAGAPPGAADAPVPARVEDVAGLGGDVLDARRLVRCQARREDAAGDVDVTRHAPRAAERSAVHLDRAGVGADHRELTGVDRGGAVPGLS